VEPLEISILVSILSAAATAVWTVWTWQEQQNIDREQKRERLAASYVNPFLLAAESLQYRLYNLLYEENALRKSNLIQNTSGFASPLTLETLYRFALYFGWENYLFRYSPYTNDPRSLELSRKVVANFIAIEGFPDETFAFSLSEQLSLGQVVVQPIGSGDSEFLAVGAIDLYRFEEELQASRESNTPLARSPGVRAAIEALEKFSNGQSLEGRQRLEAILSQLVLLVEYFEKEEGFSVAINEGFRSRLLRPQYSAGSDKAVEVVHQTARRIRLRVPRTRFDQNYADQLRERVLSLSGVTEAIVNRPSASLIVHYTAFTSQEAPDAFLVNFIQDATAVEK
jgi:hypothetical protein